VGYFRRSEFRSSHEFAGDLLFGEKAGYVIKTQTVDEGNQSERHNPFRQG
jgi:hypothetical protein